MLRARWRPGVERPTSAELEGRLRYHLEAVAQTGDATFPEALDLARRGLIDEIAGGRTPKDAVRREARTRGRRSI